MDFKTFLINRPEFKTNKTEENTAYQFKIPLEIIDCIPQAYTLGTMSYVSQADMKRIRAMYTYLFEFQDVSYDEFFDMVKVMPKYVKTIKRYPEKDFEETMSELMDHGPTYFAQEINERQGRIFNKTNKEKTL